MPLAVSLFGSAMPFPRPRMRLRPGYSETDRKESLDKCIGDLPPMEVGDQSKEFFPLMVCCRLPTALLFPQGEHRIDRSSAACRNKPGNCGTYSEGNRSPGICQWIVP